MILDQLSRADLYVAQHPLFRRAFEFLRLAAQFPPAPGRLEIDGRRLYAIVANDQGRGEAGARLESHRRYIDIQYVVAGDERIGWSALDGPAGATGLGFNDEKDIEFYTARPDSWFTVAPGSFAVFWPSDLHAPLAGTGLARKIVIKVCVDQAA